MSISNCRDCYTLPGVVIFSHRVSKPTEQCRNLYQSSDHPFLSYQVSAPLMLLSRVVSIVKITCQIHLYLKHDFPSSVRLFLCKLPTSFCWRQQSKNQAKQIITTSPNQSVNTRNVWRSNAAMYSWMMILYDDSYPEDLCQWGLEWDTALWTRVIFHNLLVNGFMNWSALISCYEDWIILTESSSMKSPT